VLTSATETKVSRAEKDRQKLLKQLKYIRRRIEKLERAIKKDAESARVLKIATSARGATNRFIAELVAAHIRARMVDPTAPPEDSEVQAAENLTAILRAYLTS
jgi:DNA-binding FrmR family transcriptional regulator